MLKILLAGWLLTANPEFDIELKKQIEWPFTVKITNELTVKSYYVNLPFEDIDQIAYLYVEAIDKFVEFSNKSCIVEPLEIRIISEEQMVSPEYFEYADPLIYGRYFKENNHMYLTLEAVKNKRYFMHEMAHYLFDTCKIDFGFDPKNYKEHKAIRRFIRSLR